ncbi:MAG: thioredoxin-dependent thiol peroxidase [Arenimonas sp.]
MLKIGASAPNFNLKTETGNTASSASLKGQRFVLYFYPKDDTPGCTKEACSFRDNLPAFNKLSVPVFGISADDEKAHGKFVSKYQLNFPLLADPEHKTCDAFGTWVEKNMYGRKYFGIQRATFVIAGNGKIEHVWEKVSPEGHAEQVLAYLKGDSVQKTDAVKKSPAAKTAQAKVLAKKTPAKKAPVAKAAVDKVGAKKAVAKKVPAKKASVKKSKA